MEPWFFSNLVESTIFRETLTCWSVMKESQDKGKSLDSLSLLDAGRCDVMRCESLSYAIKCDFFPQLRALIAQLLNPSRIKICYQKKEKMKDKFRRNMYKKNSRSVPNKRPSSMEPTLECDLHRSIHSLLSRTSTSAPNNTLFLRYTYETINEWEAWGDLSEVSHFIALTITPVDYLNSWDS